MVLTVLYGRARVFCRSDCGLPFHVEVTCPVCAFTRTLRDFPRYFPVAASQIRIPANITASAMRLKAQSKVN